MASAFLDINPPVSSRVWLLFFIVRLQGSSEAGLFLSRALFWYCEPSLLVCPWLPVVPLAGISFLVGAYLSQSAFEKFCCIYGFSLLKFFFINVVPTF